MFLGVTQIPLRYFQAPLEAGSRGKQGNAGKRSGWDGHAWTSPLPWFLVPIIVLDISIPPTASFELTNMVPIALL